MSNNNKVASDQSPDQRQISELFSGYILKMKCFYASCCTDRTHEAQFMLAGSLTVIKL